MPEQIREECHQIKLPELPPTPPTLSTPLAAALHRRDTMARS
jgi:hypothetical protein